MSVSTYFIFLLSHWICSVFVCLRSLHANVFTGEFVLPISLSGFYPWHTLQVWVNLTLCAVSVWLTVWCRWFDSISLNASVSLVYLLQQFIMYSFIPTTFRRPLAGKWVAVFLLLQSTLMSGLGERKEHDSNRDLHMLCNMEWSSFTWNTTALILTFTLWSSFEALHLTEFTYLLSNHYSVLILLYFSHINSVRELFQLVVHDCCSESATDTVCFV